MLDRIQRITSVGLFNDITPTRISFKKTSLIYGDNGRGKSTLASIMRSYTKIAPSILLKRKTLNSTLSQLVDLQFTGGRRAKFENESWNTKFSDFHVFDLDFIDTNVYSGGEISPGHRQQLLSFALGHSAVNARAEFDASNSAVAECTRLKREAEAKLTGYRGQLSISQYIRLRNENNIDDLIAANVAEQGKSQQIDLIKRKSKLKKLTEFNCNLDSFFNIMYKTVDEIDENASVIVKEHFQHFPAYGSEKWIGEGQQFIHKNTCPFCAQNIEGIALINAYKKYFNVEYSNFISEIASLDSKRTSILSKFNLAAIEQEHVNVTDGIHSWSEFLQLHISNPNFEKLKELKDNLDAQLKECVQFKSSNPLSKLDVKYEEGIKAIINEMGQCVSDFNTLIDGLNNQIDEYQLSLENINIQALTQENTRLNAIKIRHSKAVQDLIDEYTIAKANETAAKATKAAKREALDTIMQTTLGRYESAINSLLLKFGAAFTIEEISYNYLGTGEPRTEYGLKLRGSEITLQGEDAGFKTCLSEGDKRTLAFAFFIAVISEDENLNDKIVLIDDPMCSFDTHRKQQTITELKLLNDRCKQLIILAHDAYFIKSLRDEFLKRGVDVNTLSLIKVVHAQGQFSDLMALNLDDECESPYYKNHRLVSGYLNGEQFNPQDVAIAIRPLLEGYLHRRFPGHISPGKLFGEIIQLILSAQPNTPLHNALSITDELNQINSYAGRFHHDTNPNAANELVIHGELSAFCSRALNIVYRGSI